MTAQEIIQSSLNYIEDNLKTEMTLQELSSKAGYTPHHYCRLFEAVIGMPPMQYIISRRMLHAAYEMANGRLKILAAMDYGFDTYAGFYKAFKRAYGCSPSAFIKKYKGARPQKINLLQEEHIMLSQKKLQAILTNWDLDKENVQAIFNVNTGRKNENAYAVGNNYILKCAAHPGKFINHIRITQALEQAEIPAATPILTTDGKEILTHGELYFMLTKKIDGSPLRCTDLFAKPALAKAIGAAIGSLHIALTQIPKADYPAANLLSDAAAALPAVSRLTSLPENFEKDYIHAFSLLYNQLPQQLIHRDINPSNLLLTNNHLCSFFDFELSEINIRIFDLAYFSTAVLSESFTDNTPVLDNWFAIYKNLIDGYHETNPLTEEEEQALPYVIFSVQLLCIAYFSRFDKYAELTKINIDMLQWLIRNRRKLE